MEVARLEQLPGIASVQSRIQFSATVEWDNPQTIPFDDEPDRLCNEIAVEWLEKVESDA